MPFFLQQFHGTVSGGYQHDMNRPYRRVLSGSIIVALALSIAAFLFLFSDTSKAQEQMSPEPFSLKRSDVF